MLPEIVGMFAWKNLESPRVEIGEILKNNTSCKKKFIFKQVIANKVHTELLTCDEKGIEHTVVV